MLYKSSLSNYLLYFIHIAYTLYNPPIFLSLCLYLYIMYAYENMNIRILLYLYMFIYLFVIFCNNIPFTMK